MTTASSDRTPRAPPLTKDDVEALAAQLVAEMMERWRQGERPLVEDFLARHPELWQHPAAAADLIYEELCLRQEYGAEVPVEEILLRFPQWRPQLEVLFDCQRILGPRRTPPQFPAIGEFLGDFLLLAELGSGANGRVFLASQLSLGHRPVVLKVTATEFLPVREAHEHLALARLQHTHIVPLYSVQDYPARGLRALCMPYYGGATLSQLLQVLRSRLPARRTGQNLLDALDQVQAATRITPAISPFSSPVARRDGSIHGSPARQALTAATYVQAICWMGACLADALHYAHERGLVHLDLKPSNVLLAADGQPMLLDFHLAREPMHPGENEALWLGGTAGYMSPEQQAAVQAIETGRTIARPVDGRSDIYSLGLVLHEALGGNGKRPLRLCNPQVSRGLADVVSKCLADDPSDRYPHMAALATDLRRHLAHLPLCGVRNRSLAERWRKWRRRQPQGIALVGMMLALLIAGSAAAIGGVRFFQQRIPEVRRALEEGKQLMERGEWEAAIKTLQHGLSVAHEIPFQRDLTEELDARLRAAEQKRAAHALHQLANRIRFLHGAEPFPAAGLYGLEASCRTFWENRVWIVQRLMPAGAAELESVVRDDLLDLAIFWADLQGRLAPSRGREAVRHKMLAEADALFGPSPPRHEELSRHNSAPATPRGSERGRR